MAARSGHRELWIGRKPVLGADSGDQTLGIALRGLSVVLLGRARKRAL